VGFTPIEQVGKGGMGVVWRARDDETGQIVALKLLHDLYADDPEYRLRFEHELEIAKRINSPNVVKVLGYGAREGVPFIAFEFVEGPSLRERLAEHGPYSWPDTRAMLLQLAEGLADAHAAGVIHRDVKTSNVLVAPGGILKLADFGISRAADLTRVTRTSGLVGTPAYLAPEGPVDARSDLYALGIIAFELLTGSPPFEGTTYHEVLVAHLSQPPDFSNLPPEARPIVSWLLAKDPNARPQSARQLVRVITDAEPIPGTQLTVAGSPDDSKRSLSGQPWAMATPSLAGSSGAPTAASSGTMPGAVPAPVRGTMPGAAPRPAASPGFKPSPAFAIVAAIAIIALLSVGIMVVAGRPDGSPSVAPTPSGEVTARPTDSGQAAVTATATAAATATPFTGPTGVWQLFGSLPRTMWGDGAAQLPNGSVTVFGMVTGKSHTMALQTSLVDPQTGTVSAGSSMLSAQAVPGVATLSDGSVFAAGGWGGTNGSYPVSAAELLSGSTGSWSAISPMIVPRSQATVTELTDGRILVAGGWTKYASGGWTATATAEIYNRSTATWTMAQSMSTPRALATATRLADGRVLVAGGSSVYLSGRARVGREHVASSAELYDPASDSWQFAGSMSVPRSAQSAALLPNGSVLVAGGWSNGLQDGTASVDVYVPGAGWTNAAGMPGGHCQARMVTLLDGRLLEIGGNDVKDDTTIAVELFDPDSGTWQRTGSLQQPLYWPAAVVLRDGRVLVAGGSTATAISNRLEIYAPPPR
jgi:Serine/threonine protein kinase